MYYTEGNRQVMCVAFVGFTSQCNGILKKLLWMEIEFWWQVGEFVQNWVQKLKNAVIVCMPFVVMYTHTLLNK